MLKCTYMCVPQPAVLSYHCSRPHRTIMTWISISRDLVQKMMVNSVIEYSIKFLISRVFLCRSGQLKLKAHIWVLHICTMLYVTMDSQNIPGRKADKLEWWLSLKERSRYLGRERERCLFYFIMYPFILCGYGVASRQPLVGPLSRHLGPEDGTPAIRLESKHLKYARPSPHPKNLNRE